jgi:hypothetical protein
MSSELNSVIPAYLAIEDIKVVLNHEQPNCNTSSTYSDDGKARAFIIDCGPESLSRWPHFS